MKGVWNKLYIAVLLVDFVAVQAQLNSNEKDEILDVHNQFRGNTNPPAADMLRLVWDNGLAILAQSYSSRCVFEERFFNFFSFLGDNRAYTTGATNYTRLVEQWHNERADYIYSSNTCATGKVCSNYTRLVWANSRSLGCGATRCSSLSLVRETRNISNGLLLVCYYSPRGNTVGQSPYSTGTPCSSCPSSYPQCVHGTCTNASTIITPTKSPSKAGRTDPLRVSVPTVKGTEGMCPSSDTLASEISKLRNEITRILQLKYFNV